MTNPRVQQLHQSGAGIGHAVVWDGTTWVPASPNRGIDVPAVFDSEWGGTPLVPDLEFNGNTVSLPADWSWVNQGDSAYEETTDYGYLYASSTGGSTGTDTHRMLVRSIPGASAWRAFLHVADINGEAAANTRWGIVLRESSSGKYLLWGVNAVDASGWELQLNEWSATNTLATSIMSKAPMPGPLRYLLVRRFSDGTWQFRTSGNGLAWTPWWFGYDPAGFSGGAVTFDQIGFLVGVSDTSFTEGVDAELGWFRIR